MEPLHITEFASERYFSKLKQLNQQPEHAASSSSASTSSSSTGQPATGTAHRLPTQPNTFTLPLGRQRSLDHHESQQSLPTLTLRPSEQKKRSLGHDLTGLRTQRRPTFTGSFGSLRSKVAVTHKSASIAEHREVLLLAQDPSATAAITLGQLFLALPTELQAQIIAPLPIHTILDLRLVSKSLHILVTINESPIARYHVVHSLPPYARRLYPAPEPHLMDLHYLCSIWHRLHVAMKLATKIASYATKDIFLRNTEAQRREFEPQHRRMRRRLLPLVFTIFHFFETSRDIHVRRLTSHAAVPLRRQAFTMNPIECQVMSMYDDQTLLRVHEAFPLVISSFSRRLRPPSYAGRLERSIKGYLKDRPADEVYATILSIGGLRQAQRFWETKGYSARRAAVDTWYALVTRNPVEAPQKSKISFIPHLGRKKSNPLSDASTLEGAAGHGSRSCNDLFCVEPTCRLARRRHSTDNLVFGSSLAAGPPMSPLPRDQLRLVLSDAQPLSSIWLHTAEALILERQIVERPQDIKRNHQVLLELIRDDGTDGTEDWILGNMPEATRIVNTEQTDGGISD